MNRARIFPGLATSAIVASMLSTAPATAQALAVEGRTAAGPSVQDEPSGNEIKEIVVTAEKRQGTAQKTGIAMTVFTADKLAENGVGDLGALARIAPSVNFSVVRTAAVVTIRGVSSRDTTEIGDPAVALSVDGFYYQRAIGLNDSVFDLERVEVLRGPQGTLYGRNATGGAINFITAKPKNKFEAAGKVGYGAYNQLTTEGMLNVPVADWLAVRASFATRAHDGYRNNAPAANGDDANARAARLHLLFTPSSNLSILLTGEYVQLGGVGPTIVGAPLVFGPGNVIIHERPVLPADSRTFPLDMPSQFINSKSYAVRSQIDYDFGFAKLTYLAGYRHLDFSRLSDGDGIFSQNIYFLSDETLKTQSHELRLSSNGTSPFIWQIGGYYFEELDDLYATQRGYPIIATQTTAQTANFKNYFRYPDVSIKSKAVFAQVGYEINDSLKVEAGIRYSNDKKRRVGVSNTTSSGPLTAVCDMGPFGLTNCPNAFVAQSGSSNDKRTTYHAAVNYQATPRNLLYAKFDTGYKSGGFSDIVQYGPEDLTAYELGSKNRFFDNRLQVNLSAFYYNYKNQQVGQVIQGRTQTINAGKSTIYGGEIEATAILSENDRIDGSISYLHARFNDFNLVVSGKNTNLAGNRPPQAPTISFNAGYEHDFDVLSGTLTPRIQTHYESHSFLQVNNFNSDRQDAYTRTDLVVTFKPKTGNWSVMAYVRNIEDTAILQFAQERAAFGTYAYQFDAPRTYGAELSFKF